MVKKIKIKPSYKLASILYGKIAYTKNGAKVIFYNKEHKKIGTYSFEGCRTIYESQLKIYGEMLALWATELPFVVKFSEDKKNIQAFSVKWNRHV